MHFGLQKTSKHLLRLKWVHIQNSPIQNSLIQTLRQSKTVRFKVLDFAAITGSKFRIECYPLLACSQHFGATTGPTVLLLSLLNKEKILVYRLFLLGTVFGLFFIGLFFRSFSLFSGLFGIGLFCTDTIKLG